MPRPTSDRPPDLATRRRAGIAASSPSRPRAVCAVLALALGLAHAGSAAAESWQVSARDGLVLELEEPALRLDLDGRFALDWVEYDDRNVRDSGPRLDRSWLSLAAALGESASGRVSFDLAGIDTRGPLWEAWGAFAPLPGLRLTAGLMRLPLGMEALLGEGAQPLPGYPGFLSFLTDRTDWALRLDGELGEGLLDYELSAALGEGFDWFGERRTGSQLAGRLTSYPLRFLDTRVELGPYAFPLFSGWFVSGAYAWSPDFGGRLDVATPLRNTLFATSRLDARGHSCFVLGWGVDLGPLRLIHELTRGSLEGVRVPGGGRRDLDDQITAWQILVSWRLTGEPYDSRPFRNRDAHRPAAPARALDASGDERGPGAIELAFRYANGDIDRDFFTTGLTSYTLSSQEFRTASLGLNWDPTPWLRVSGEVVRTLADQQPAAFRSHGRDTSGLARVQLAF